MIDGEGAQARAVTAAPRRAALRAIAALAIVAGVTLTALLVARFGWRPVSVALARVGLSGFAVFCGYTLGVFILLGVAWFVLARGVSMRLLPAFVFGRLLREAGADILPFSQLGGFVMGARGAVLLGAPSAVAVASQIVDLATEMIGQILFTALGVALVTVDAPKKYPHRWLDPLLWGGLAVGATAAGVFVAAQLADWVFLDRFAARWPSTMRAQLDAVRATLRAAYHPATRVVISGALHLAAWVAASGGVWIVLRAMHAPLSFDRVIMLETLIYLLRSAAFFVPGAIGVLEGGYILLGPVLGLAPEAALGLSLLKRGRDVALGVPAIVAWQVLEGGRLWGRAPTARVLSR